MDCLGMPLGRECAPRSFVAACACKSASAEDRAVHPLRRSCGVRETSQCFTGGGQCWSFPHTYRVLLRKLVGGLQRACPSAAKRAPHSACAGIRAVHPLRRSCGVERPAGASREGFNLNPSAAWRTSCFCTDSRQGLPMRCVRTCTRRCGVLSDMRFDQ